MIRIAFDSQSVHGNKTGIGVYTDSIVNSLKANMPNDIQVDFYPNTPSARYSGSMKTPRRLEWEVSVFPKLSRGYEIAHIPGFAMGWHNARSILTVHDLIGIVFPNQTTIAGQFYWGRWLPWAVQRADHIIAISEHTSYDIQRLLKISPKKISVIYPSGHEAYSNLIDDDDDVFSSLKKRLGIRDSFILSVGTLEPRKNLRRVIEAHSLLRARNSKYQAQLLVVGSHEFAKGKFFSSLSGSHKKPQNDLIFTGFLTPAELQSLYHHALALIYPSLYEGFGLPLLEAMGAGCPVITSRMSALPEVGGDAAIYVNAEKVESIAGAIQILYSDPAKRAELIEAGKLRITLFSWKKSALQIFDVYRKVAHGS
ncbi:MAG TPA: hypothetical protein DIS66_06605 [Candidatus Omnitrophica bacterium]|nr:hypothetical protein [Candidatus Omnitrophota bacterium]